MPEFRALMKFVTACTWLRPSSAPWRIMSSSVSNATYGFTAPAP
jgi:hypothetical protein